MEWNFPDTNKSDFFRKSKTFIDISLFGNHKPSSSGLKNNSYGVVRRKYSEIYTSVDSHPEFGHCQSAGKSTLNVELQKIILTQVKNKDLLL